MLTRVSDSFGPIYAERVDTVGKGRFNLGINYSHFTFDEIDNLNLRDGDVRLVFTHEDTNHDGDNETLFFEGDVITAAAPAEDRDRHRGVRRDLRHHRQLRRGRRGPDRAASTSTP